MHQAHVLVTFSAAAQVSGLVVMYQAVQTSRHECCILGCASHTGPCAQEFSKHTRHHSAYTNIARTPTYHAFHFIPVQAALPSCFDWTVGLLATFTAAACIIAADTGAFFVGRWDMSA